MVIIVVIWLTIIVWGLASVAEEDCSIDNDSEGQEGKDQDGEG